MPVDPALRDRLTAVLTECERAGCTAHDVIGAWRVAAENAGTYVAPAPTEVALTLKVAEAR